jgi:cysteine/glycine-rich protein
MPGICPRCSKNVYFAEERQAVGKSWHKLCFTCSACRKMLDSGRVTEHNDEMFCSSCYRKNFGPKGYGFGGGAGCLSMDDGEGYKSNGAKNVENGTKNEENGGTAAAAANNSPKKAPLAETNSNSSVGDQVDGKKPVKKSTAPPRKWGGAEVCPRCNKSVFIAELMRGAGRAWHRTCFTCNMCSKGLDSSMLCEREAEIFCKACYGRNFGPKGFGYGIGAGTMQMSS